MVPTIYRARCFVGRIGLIGALLDFALGVVVDQACRFRASGSQRLRVRTILYYNTQNKTISSILCETTLYYIILCYTIAYHTVLFYAILHCVLRSFIGMTFS